MTAAAINPAAELSRALAARIEDVAVHLFGEPTFRGKGELRFRRRGSLSVVVAGQKLGSWYDHESGTGGDPLDLVRLANGGSLIDAMRWAAGWLPSDAVSEPRAEPERGRTHAPETDTTRPALATWSDCLNAAGSLAERYLAGRGLSLPPDDHEVIRFHPACPFKGERVPAMVGLLRDIGTNEPCAIHRTALLPNGSDRDRARGKAMLGRAKGAVVKLSADDQVTMGLGIAEGIETGLAVLGIGWRPVWAAASAGGIAKFPMLPGVEELQIFANHDAAGQDAANECGRRWAEAGRAVTIRSPRLDGDDWCDMVAHHAR